MQEFVHFEKCFQCLYKLLSKTASLILSRINLNAMLFLACNYLYKTLSVHLFVFFVHIDSKTVIETAQTFKNSYFMKYTQIKTKLYHHLRVSQS